MYAIIDKVNQRLIGLHKSAEDMGQYLEQEPLPKEFVIVFVETLEELYNHIYEG